VTEQQKCLMHAHGALARAADLLDNAARYMALAGYESKVNGKRNRDFPYGPSGNPDDLTLDRMCKSAQDFGGKADELRDRAEGLAPYFEALR
jgi:hypothetical protein